MVAHFCPPDSILKPDSIRRLSRKAIRHRFRAADDFVVNQRVYRLSGGTNGNLWSALITLCKDVSGSTFLQIGPIANNFGAVVQGTGNSVIFRQANNFTGGTQIVRGLNVTLDVGNSTAAFSNSAPGSGYEYASVGVGVSSAVVTLPAANSALFGRCVRERHGSAPGTYVKAINGTSITLSNPYTGVGTTQALTFGGSVEVFGALTLGSGSATGYGGVASLVNAVTGKNYNEIILRPGGQIIMNDVAGEVPGGQGRWATPRR